MEQLPYSTLVPDEVAFTVTVTLVARYMYVDIRWSVWPEVRPGAEEGFLFN